MEVVKVAKLDERGILPTRKNPADAGMDFYAPYDVVVEPNSLKIVRTYITVEVPEGYVLLLFPKGRNNHLIGGGVIDAYYQPGEILVKVVNPTKEPLILKRGDGIAQGIFFKIPTPEIVEVDVNELKIEKEIAKNRSGKGGIVSQLMSENLNTD